MAIIDQLENFNLIRRRKAVAAKNLFMQHRDSSKKKACMPTTEKMKDLYEATVTHIKMK
ncbi:MAG: hypothetical protein M9958_11120 [Chitinophagales bacterium]|nr:hypothetical protein [Chitinophagales bacterium]